MKCSEAQHWLLTSRSSDRLPSSVENHVGACPRCRQTRQQLNQLDEAVRRRRLPPGRPSSRAELDQRLVAKPPGRPHATPGRRPWPRLYWPLAACLLLGLAWLAGSYQGRWQRDDAWARQELALLARVARHDAEIAEATSRRQVMAYLNLLAGSLKDEAIRRARGDNWRDLDLLSGLYQRVLRSGLVGQYAALPAEQRPAVATEMVQQLRAAGRELEETSDKLVPALGDMLTAMQAAAVESAKMLETDAPTVTPSLPLPDPASLLASLVMGGLRLAEERDVLGRAGICAELAGQVTTCVVFAAGAEQAERAAALGDALGRLLQQCGSGLDQATGENPPGRRRSDLVRVLSRAMQVANGLDKNLAQAPPRAREPLQVALAAAGPGLGRIRAISAANPAATPERVREGK